MDCEGEPLALQIPGLPQVRGRSVAGSGDTGVGIDGGRMLLPPLVSADRVGVAAAAKADLRKCRTHSCLDCHWTLPMPHPWLLGERPTCPEGPVPPLVPPHPPSQAGIKVRVL